MRLLAGILASGLFLVIRNLAGFNLSSGFIIGLDLGHLGVGAVVVGRDDRGPRGAGIGTGFAPAAVEGAETVAPLVLESV